MPKYRVKSQPLGLLGTQPWPEVGETVEFAEEIGDGMVAAGILEKPEVKKPAKKVEKRPASRKGEEKR